MRIFRFIKKTREIFLRIRLYRLEHHSKPSWDPKKEIILKNNRDLKELFSRIISRDKFRKKGFKVFVKGKSSDREARRIGVVWRRREQIAIKSFQIKRKGNLRGDRFLDFYLVIIFNKNVNTFFYFGAFRSISFRFAWIWFANLLILGLSPDFSIVLFRRLENLHFIFSKHTSSFEGQKILEIYLIHKKVSASKGKSTGNG